MQLQWIDLCWLVGGGRDKTRGGVGLGTLPLLLALRVTKKFPPKSATKPHLGTSTSGQAWQAKDNLGGERESERKTKKR
jgi:hypothetical protein